MTDTIEFETRTGDDDDAGIGDDVLWDILDSATREEEADDGSDATAEDVTWDTVESEAGQKRGIGDDIIWDIVE